MRTTLPLLCASLVVLWGGCAATGVRVKPGPAVVPCFEIYEITVQLDPPPDGNPFTDVQVTAAFTPQGGSPIKVDGFCDDQEGRCFRVRFCPAMADTRYKYSLSITPSAGEQYAGTFRTTRPAGMEPVVVDPERPRHFQFALSHKPFYHVGLTAYHLLDPSNDDRQIQELLDYCVQNGFNKVRFLLTGYPRDTDTRSMAEYDAKGDPWKQPNYGAPPGEVNPLPAWPGEPHNYDFTRFNVAYWQKVDLAVQAARDRGIIATCIVTIEKQDLPHEYGVLTDHEKRLYRYAVARLAAFSNIWWDLGNEHIEYRKPDWAPKMGALVKQWDPYHRLCSAHGYAEWTYSDQPWADFIITQQYGDCSQVNEQVLKYRAIPKPYVNEEYGYEGVLDKPDHGQNADWVRKCHWAIALAGGYATYGDWTAETAFYTGDVGQGKAPAQLRHLRETFESIPYSLMEPHNELVGRGAFCLAEEGQVYLAYLPDGAETVLRAKPFARGHAVTWINPRTGERKSSGRTTEANVFLQPPSPEDWAVLIRKN